MKYIIVYMLEIAGAKPEYKWLSSVYGYAFHI